MIYRMAEPHERRLVVQVNGRTIQVSPRSTVADLLAQLGAPRYVAVEVNGEVVPRSQHTQTQLADGDIIELVTLVGGG